MKKVLFICGSPNGKHSTSFVHADFMRNFLEHPHEIVSLFKEEDHTQTVLSANAEEKEDAFLKIAGKIENADAVVWVTGAQCYFVPVQMQYLFEKLIAQNYRFEGKLAATLLTTYGVLDDYIHEKIRDVSEQLGFGHIGDISVSGSPFDFNSRESESQCQALAGKINRALASGYVPPRESNYVDRRYLSPVISGNRDAHEDGDVLAINPASGNKPAGSKNGGKTIVLVSGNAVSKDPAAGAVYEYLAAHSQNTIRLIEIENHHIQPCVYCRKCVMSVTGECCLKDDYAGIEKQLFAADGIIYLGNCAAGIVDSRFRTFLGRTGKLLNQPVLRDKHGVVISTGGGPLGKSGARHLENFLTIYGVHTIAALAENAAEPDQFRAQLRWAIENLDLAMAENWQAPDRFTAIGEHLIMREVSMRFGYMVRGNYIFFKKEKRYTFPSRLLTAVLYPFFASLRMRNALETFIINYFLQKKKQRLAALSYDGNRGIPG